MVEFLALEIPPPTGCLKSVSIMEDLGCFLSSACFQEHVRLADADVFINRFEFLKSKILL